MTRINAGIPVEVLTDQHLLAEHRELPRICNYWGKSPITPRLTLGKGHVLWFADKPNYTLFRYQKIHSECKKRGFNVEDYSSSWDDIPKGDSIWVPSYQDARLLFHRILDRIVNSKIDKFRFWGVYEDKSQSISRLAGIFE